MNPAHTEDKDKVRGQRVEPAARRPKGACVFGLDDEH